MDIKMKKLVLLLLVITGCAPFVKFRESDYERSKLNSLNNLSITEGLYKMELINDAFDVRFDSVYIKRKHPYSEYWYLRDSVIVTLFQHSYRDLPIDSVLYFFNKNKKNKKGKGRYFIKDDTLVVSRLSIYQDVYFIEDIHYLKIMDKTTFKLEYSDFGIIDNLRRAYKDTYLHLVDSTIVVESAKEVKKWPVELSTGKKSWYHHYEENPIYYMGIPMLIFLTLGILRSI